jgi:molybdopterin-guanine dinucleotide biosynthesis protein A
MLDVDGFILLGGASSRMGTDKARLDLGGKRFVDRIADALNRITNRVSVVGASESQCDWQLLNVPDVYPNWGAFGGVHAALASCQAEFAAIVACDLPFVTGELFELLASLSEECDAVVPIQDDGRVQPLCAMYRRKACLAAAELLIERGERRPRAMLEHVRTRLVPTSEFQSMIGASLFLMNINTTEDFEQARKAMVSHK